MPSSILLTLFLSGALFAQPTTAEQQQAYTITTKRGITLSFLIPQWWSPVANKQAGRFFAQGWTSDCAISVTTDDWADLPANPELVQALQQFITPAGKPKDVRTTPHVLMRLPKGYVGTMGTLVAQQQFRTDAYAVANIKGPDSFFIAVLNCRFFGEERRDEEFHTIRSQVFGSLKLQP
jgi:hypothetical protein